MRKLLKYSKKCFVVIILSLVIFNLLMLLFAIYEYNVSWGENESWCAEPQILSSKKAKRSIILVHGFGGSPFDYKPLAKKLQEQDFHVTIPIMPGQNKNIFAYNRNQHTPGQYILWLQEIVQEETKRFDQKPYLIGFSMGGALSTIIATENNVKKLVLIAPYYATPNHGKVVFLRKIFGKCIPILPKLASGKINSKLGRNEYIPGTFIVSVGAFEQLDLLAKIAQKKASNININTLIVASENDDVASFRPIKKLFSKNSHVQIKNYPKSNHVMLYDFSKKEIISEIVTFLGKNN